MIYMLWAEGTRRFKIGFTQRDPELRRREIDAYSPIRVHLISVIGGSKADEQRLQRELRRYLVKGEWFEMEQVDILEAVRRICKPSEEELQNALKLLNDA